MDRWDKSLREDRYRNGKENPSFSSTLLDSIYRSIDEGNGEGEEELIFYRETMRKKHGGAVKEDEMTSLRRACMIEKWMEKKVSEKVVVRRKSVAADFDRNSRSHDRDSVLLNSSSSSSDSSCGGGFSSSEAESVYGLKSKSSSAMQRLKPIRTSVSVRPEIFEKPENVFHVGDDYHGERNYVQKTKHEESGFVKTKSRALKIYGDLKNVKQPISPGGRLASFLNSLFSAGTAKKANISSSVGGYNDNSPGRKSKSTNASTCSSASSFSRSCLSKTPSSRGKLSSNGGAKRSVRFYPVSIIVDEDCRPCGHKSLYGDEPSFMAVPKVRTSFNPDMKVHIMKENLRVEGNARDLLKNYQKNDDFDMKDPHNDDDDDNDDEDVASCSSSDLFELDNLSAIGIDKYCEELPVYETTHLDTNRAIANGLIL